MKRFITVKVGFNGRRQNVPSTQAVVAAFTRAVPGQGVYGANATVTLVSTTEGAGRPGTPEPTTAKGLVAELERVSNGTYDSTAQARVKALVARIKTALG
jgi:hypothetical protein